MPNLVSIIIPIYNVEKYLDVCIQSVVNQTYHNLEIILVDDGSPDNCGIICDTWARKDERIIVVHKTNGGLSDARNAGLDIAKGDFIAFVDSDDYIDEKMVETLLSKIGDSAIAICNYDYVDEYGNNMIKPAKQIQCDAVWDEDRFWDEHHICNCQSCIVAWSKLYRRDLFHELRFDYGKIHEDEYIIDKIIEQCNAITVCTDILYHYRQRPGSIMSQQFQINKLDAVDAVLSRTIRFLNRKKYRCFVYSYALLCSILASFSTVIPKSDTIAQNKYKNQMKQFRKLYFIAFMYRMPMKIFIKVTAFFVLGKYYSNVKRRIPNMDTLRKQKSLLTGYFQTKSDYLSYPPDTIFLYGAPEHGNLGDQAIFLAEYTWISRLLPDSNIVVIPEAEMYQNLINLSRFSKKHPCLCIYHGGGNLGDLYRYNEEARLASIKRLKKANIIIMPQSIDYTKDSKNLSHAKKVYESHPSLLLFTREENSEKKRTEFFPRCKGALVPDIVLSYHPDIAPTKRKGVLFCTRSDIEKNTKNESFLSELEQSAKTVFASVQKTDTCSNAFQCPYPQQKEQLDAFWKSFSSAELVITDRLHGLIFAWITNTPCIALDNTTGKVGSLYRTWLQDSDVIFVEDAASLERAKAYVLEKSYQADVSARRQAVNLKLDQAFQPLKDAILGGKQL